MAKKKFFYLEMLTDILHGTATERVRALIAVALVFSAGAFASSVVLPYLEPTLDRLVDSNLSGPFPAILGGALATIIASIKLS